MELVSILLPFPSFLGAPFLLSFFFFLVFICNKVKSMGFCFYAQHMRPLFPPPSLQTLSSITVHMLHTPLLSSLCFSPRVCLSFFFYSSVVHFHSQYPLLGYGDSLILLQFLIWCPPSYSCWVLPLPVIVAWLLFGGSNPVFFSTCSIIVTRLLTCHNYRFIGCYVYKTLPL